jgi:hypothetical protein
MASNQMPPACALSQVKFLRVHENIAYPKIYAARKRKGRTGIPVRPFFPVFRASSPEQGFS